MDIRLQRALIVSIALAFFLLLSAQNPPAPLSIIDKSPRRALIIGNSSYLHLPRVETASGDVSVIESALKALQFEVLAITDLQTNVTQRSKIEGFAESVQSAEVVLFFYTGHAVQMDGDNFLLPEDFDPTSKEPIGSRAYSITRLMNHLSRAKARIVVIDASRPLPGSGYPSGLADLSGSERTLLAFSAAPDTTSPNPRKQGQTTTYAECTASSLRKPGLTVPEAFEEVKTCVSKATDGQQEPRYKNDGLASLRFRESPPQINVPKQNPKDNQEYVWIPEGEFAMGCVPDDDRCEPDEKPAHFVRITHGFWMGVSEVTVTAYLRYAKVVKHVKRPHSPNSNKRWAHTDFPIVNVSWLDAVGYCSWAGGRLPTEAEWEYAARGGVEGKKYPWGNEIDHSKAKYNKAFRGRNTGLDLWDEVAPVRNFQPPNGWGLYDVVGNVREWCSDWYRDRYDPTVVDDPKGPPDGKTRVLRSGSFNSSAEGVRLSSRYHWNPKEGFNQDGFRCVIDNLP